MQSSSKQNSVTSNKTISTEFQQLVNKQLREIEQERLKKKDGSKYWTKSKDQKKILENEF